MVLRSYESGDSEWIARWTLNEQSFYQWSRGKLGEYPMSAAQFRYYFDQYLGLSDYFPLVMVDDDGTPRGEILLHYPTKINGNIRFAFIIVDPEIRGQGYGKTLLRLASEHAIHIFGAKTASLGVFENNPAARHCYETAGFQTTGEMILHSTPLGNWNWQEMQMNLQNNKNNEVLDI